MNSENLRVITEAVKKDEEILFNGCFNESIVRFDLSTRRNEKRDFYIESFNKLIDSHRTMLNVLFASGESNLIERINKCKNEASRLLDIVYEY